MTFRIYEEIKKANACPKVNDGSGSDYGIVGNCRSHEISSVVVGTYKSSQQMNLDFRNYLQQHKTNSIQPSVEVYSYPNIKMFHCADR